MWQTCPRCQGNGIIESILSSSSFQTCNICNGKGIISELNGLPPNYFPSTDNPTVLISEKKSVINNEQQLQDEEDNRTFIDWYSDMIDLITHIIKDKDLDDLPETKRLLMSEVNCTLQQIIKVSNELDIDLIRLNKK